MTENQRLSGFAYELRDVDNKIEVAENELEILKSEKRRLERDVLPELMQASRIKSFELRDGSRITLSTMAEGSLPKGEAERAAAIKWLADNGYGELIENKVTSSWSRGDREKAQAEYERLAALGTAKVTFDETIHPKTLGARMRDRVVTGLPTPLETLGVSVFPRARFTKTASNDP
jgi:hypothetical protein